MLKIKKVGGIALAAAVLTIFTGVGCAVEETDDEEFSYDEELDEEDEVSTESSALGGCHQCNNCVDYARCRQPRLPYGLTSWADKRSRINSQRARARCVAMINTGSYYGHVAYVRKVRGRKVFIAEGNWPSGQCGQRSGTKGGLNIAGYWCP